ncbi:MAG: AbrB/MazE/SpoVT family DNA-binding domain-containing protein [Chloroflexi bacterium]|nr:AbrB/MazE/SpoVT family DNA-binding domain-containing protein [Chloroflexota bacterium]
MSEYVTTVTQKGQVTIPGELRKALKIKPKDKVAFTLVDGEVRLRPMTSRLLAGYGAVKPKARPEDFHRMRQEVEEEWGEEAGREA